MKSVPRYNLLTELNREIFGSIKQRRVDFVDDLISQHIQATDNSTMGFIHRGEYYRHSGATHKNIGKRFQRLHKSLRGPLDDFLRNEQKVLSNARPVVEGYLRKILLMTLHKESLFKLLPSSVHPTVDEWHQFTQVEYEFPSACQPLDQDTVQSLQDTHAEAIRLIKTFKVRTMIMS